MAQDTKELKLKNKRGQTVIEYVLLLSVLMSLAALVFNSKYFKDFLGDDSELFEKLKKRYEYSYRHGVFGEDDTNAKPTNIRGQQHDTFNGRFFGPAEPYP